VHSTRLLRSSTFRLALLYVALLTASVLILLGFIYWATAGYMSRQTDLTIEAEIKGLAEQYRRRGLKGLSVLLAERVARDPAGSNVYLLADQSFEPLVGNLDRWPEVAADEGGWMSFRLKARGPGGSEEHQARARAFLLRGGLHLLVGRDVRELEATRQLIVEALAWGMAITLALALVGGLTMSSGTVRRIEAINQTSREIMGGDLGRRIPTHGTADDFDQLAENLNNMLERILVLMQGIRQVSDNIAHDLRTPLTRLRTRLELALSPGSDRREIQTAIEQAIADADALLATFNALLRIARIESRSQRAGFRELELSVLARDVTELYEPLANEKGQTLDSDLQGEAWVRGDRDLLSQMLANLLDNAIKYTPRDGKIRVVLRSDSRNVELVVADSGPGIAPQLRDRVFQRFFRSEESRSTPGSGLGLSLAHAVAGLHDVRIRLEDNAPGLRVVLVFQRPAEASGHVGDSCAHH
jgi:signal transduction histidine kinase